MTEMLVDKATTFEDAAQAVFRMVKERPYVSSLDIEAIPVLAYAHVLGNRKGLSVDTCGAFFRRSKCCAG